MTEPATETRLPTVANVHRLTPLRILLVGRDRKFVRVTAFLLTTRGYGVAEAELGDMLRVAERDKPDVVLVEADASRGAVASVVTQLAALPSSPAVVVATDAPDRLWPQLRCVEKWAPIEEFVLEIERASLERNNQNGQP
jgi:CheY-like chemotaxis protein